MDSEISSVRPVQVVLSPEEKVRCLEEIISRLKKIIFVYEKSQEPGSTYNYRVFCSGVMMYVSSSNALFNGELVTIVVNVNSILMQRDIDKQTLKKLVFDSVNFAEYSLHKIEKDLAKEKDKKEEGV